MDHKTFCNLASGSFASVAHGLLLLWPPGYSPSEPLPTMLALLVVLQVVAQFIASPNQVSRQRSPLSVLPFFFYLKEPFLLHGLPCFTGFIALTTT